MSHLDIVLYLSTFSATAPLTALAKKMGFRGATMHGCNETILHTGLARNYEEVSAKAERFRQALTRCDKRRARIRNPGADLSPHAGAGPPGGAERATASATCRGNRQSARR